MAQPKNNTPKEYTSRSSTPTPSKYVSIGAHKHNNVNFRSII